MTSLPVDFKDSVLNSEMGGARRYHVVKNDDGTYASNKKIPPLKRVRKNANIVWSNFGESWVDFLSANWPTTLVAIALSICIMTI